MKDQHKKLRGGALRLALVCVLCAASLCLAPLSGQATGTYTIGVGETVTLYWQASGVTNIGQVVWAISGTSATKVSSTLYSCTVKGVSAGTVTVSAAIYYYIQSPAGYIYQMNTTDAFTVNVKQTQPTSVSLNYSSYSLREGSTLVLTPTLSPSGTATSYTWSSSDSSVASVSSGGVVTANLKGSATIMVSTSNGKTASCHITVTDPLAVATSTTPSNLAQNVATGTKPSVTFSAAVSAGDSFGAIRLIRQSNQSTVSGTASISGSKVVFTPTAALNVAESYQLVVPAGAVKNKYGTTNASDTAVSFTTVAFATIASAPAEGQTDVPIAGPIKITFDSAPVAGSAFGGIQLAASGTSAPVTCALSDKVLTITPKSPLNVLTYYTLSIPANALTHSNGVSYALSYTLHFTTSVAEGTFAGGSGTVEDPYLIANEQQLKRMTDLKSKCFKLVSDIKIAATWTPVGSIVSPFTGRLDGNFHAITNLAPNSAAHGGLFGYLSGATVKNLTIRTRDNPLTLNYSSDTGAQGTLAERASQSTITGCVVSGQAQMYGVWKYGAILGQADNCTIRGCSSYMKISLTYTEDFNVGGLIGYASGTSVDGCLFSGSMTFSDEDANLHHDDTIATCGGLIGKIDNGSLSGSSTRGSVVFNHLQYCAPETLYVGGLVGDDVGGPVSGCSSSASIEVQNLSTVSGSFPDAYVGGLFGGSYSNSITNCHSSCAITSTARCMDSVKSYNGGIAGLTNTVNISRCYATGTINSTAEARRSSTASNNYAGGLVGKAIAGSITDCFARGTVTGRAKALSGSTYGTPHVGSLAGAANGVVQNCYALGPCYVAYPFSSTDYSTSYFVFEPGSLSGCYALVEASEAGVDVLTEAQMHMTGSFAGWDFGNTWGIDLDTNDGYPMLHPEIKGVSATGCELTFDALPHQIAVTAPSDATIEYSLDGDAFTAENPSFTATAAPVTVFYRVSWEDKRMTGLATVNILPVITKVSMDTTALNVGTGIHYQIQVTVTASDPALAGVVWTSSNPDVLSVDADGWLIAKAPGTVVVTCAAWDGSGFGASRTVNVHQRVALQGTPFITEIGARAFMDCAFDEINLEICENLTSIGSQAFANCANLNAVYIGKSVTSIAADAFSGCSLVCLYCYEGSAAQAYAIAQGIRYELLDR